MRDCVTRWSRVDAVLAGGGVDKVACNVPVSKFLPLTTVPMSNCLKKPFQRLFKVQRLQRFNDESYLFVIASISGVHTPSSGSSVSMITIRGKFTPRSKVTLKISQELPSSAITAMTPNPDTPVSDSTLYRAARGNFPKEHVSLSNRGTGCFTCS